MASVQHEALPRVCSQNVRGCMQCLNKLNNCDEAEDQVRDKKAALACVTPGVVTSIQAHTLRHASGSCSRPRALQFFDEGDLALATTFAAFVAAAIERAKFTEATGNAVRHCLHTCSPTYPAPACFVLVRDALFRVRVHSQWTALRCFASFKSCSLTSAAASS
eukprot:4113901-Pleurochrysis_carterae.AAC.6